MKIAIVHDFLTQEGGAEKVLRAILDAYPQAPLYTLFYDKDRVSPYYRSRNIKTSFLQHLPLGKRTYQWYLPLMPTATESLDLREFDIIISSTSAFTKGIITKPNTLHICYCHTPTRYLWTDTHEYIENLNYNWIIKKIIPLYLHKLRMWDLLAAKRVDYFLANSKTVQNRIQKYYQQTSEILFPPAETHKFSINNEKNSEKYYITGGRLVSYKRYDLAIKACNEMNIPLKIFGTGPELSNLKAIAGPKTEFLGFVSDKKRAELYSQAIAFIHPQEEDFGITAVESMASGRPVLAYNKGGATETVIDQKTGILFNEQSVESLAQAMKDLEKLQLSPQEIQKHAHQFSVESFQKQLTHIVNTQWELFQSRKNDKK